MSTNPINILQDAQAQDQAAEINATAYDSLWAGGDIPIQELSRMEQIMLSNDKLYVVLAVVLIIWVGIVLLLLRNDRRLKEVERSVAERIPDMDDEL